MEKQRRRLPLLSTNPLAKEPPQELQTKCSGCQFLFMACMKAETIGRSHAAQIVLKLFFMSFLQYQIPLCSNDELTSPIDTLHTLHTKHSLCQLFSPILFIIPICSLPISLLHLLQLFTILFILLLLLLLLILFLLLLSLLLVIL